MARGGNPMNAAVLSSRVTLLGASSGAAVSFDASKLTNLTRTPMEIRELIASAVSQNTGAPGGTPFALVNLKGKVGRHSMTDGETPIAVLGPARQWEADHTRSLPQMSTYLSGRGYTSLIRWQFRRPLVLRPGAGFTFEARFSADDIALLVADMDDVVVTLTAVGRYLPVNAPVPRVQSVPYVSSARLRVDNVDNSGGDQLILSRQGELENSNAGPFEVNRIVGVRFAFGSVGPSAHMVNTMTADTASHMNVSDFTNELFNLRFPDRTTLAAERIPFDAIFGQRRSLEGAFVVPPSGRCVAELFAFQRNFTGVSIPVATEVVKLGIVGDRLEVL
jgi:hypothetical protein